MQSSAQEEADALRAQAAGLAEQGRQSAQVLLQVQAELAASMERCSEAEDKMQALQEMAEASANAQIAAAQECSRLEEDCAASANSLHTATAELEAAREQCCSLQAQLDSMQQFYGSVDQDKRVLQERCSRCCACPVKLLSGPGRLPL